MRLVTQIAFLLRSYASFELPKNSVCYLINGSQTEHSVGFMISRDTFLDQKKKWLTLCLFNRCDYSHVSREEEQGLPHRPTNRGNTIYKVVPTLCFIQGTTQTSLHGPGQPVCFLPQGDDLSCSAFLASLDAQFIGSGLLLCKTSLLFETILSEERRMFTSKEEGAHRSPTTRAPWSQASSPQNCEKRNVSCLSSQSVVFRYGSPGRLRHHPIPTVSTNRKFSQDSQS